MCIASRGDNQSYSCVLRSKSGESFAAKFTARKGYTTIKLPLSSFKSGRGGKTPLGSELVHMSLRFDKAQSSQVVTSVQDAAAKFNLSLEW